MNSMGRFVACAALGAALSMSLQARAQQGAPGVDDAGVDADLDAAPRVWASCSEHVPPDTSRPKLTQSFPSRGLAGFAIPLRITVEHGKGESVLPNGFQTQSNSDAARALTEAGFALPSADGGSGPSMHTTVGADKAVTELVIPFVALPQKPGRQSMVLPPVPVALARASGELVTVCTEPHTILIEDPTANVPEAAPHPNPPPVAQREQWTLARDLTIGTAIGALVAAAGTWLVLRWLRRPRPVPPPPPPRPPWEVAFEEMGALRSSNMLNEGQLVEYADRVSDIVRRYLGGRFDFDGIESTTDEVLQFLRRVTPPLGCMTSISTLLGECDLVKFARMTPTAQDCISMLSEADQIVRQTMPQMQPAPSRAPSAPSQGEAQ